MKQIYNILSIAALVIAGVMTTGCVDQLNDPQQPQDGGKTVTLTTTVGLEGATKALTAGGVKTFAAGDQIAVIYKNTSGQTKKVLSNALTGVGTDISTDGHYATFSAALTDAAAGGAVRYIYPAAMAKTTVATDAVVNSDAATVDFTNLDAQDGTLESLAATLDLATYDGTLTSDAALPSGITLSNQLCILELVLKSKQGSAVTKNITGLTISDGTNTYTITPSSLEKIYVAMQPVTSAQTLTFTASGYGTPLTKEVTGQTLEKNNLYPVNLTLTHLIDLSAIDVSDLPQNNGKKYYLVVDGDVLTGTLAENYKISIADGATVTLAGVSINDGPGWTSGEYAGITCLGNATINLAAGTENTVKGFASGWPGIYVPGNHDTSTYSTLTIQGSGTLNARGGSNAPGMGGASDHDGGNIVIKNGTINATGKLGAGIGAGDYAHFGTITISGGTVTATARDDYGAGIGTSGYSVSCGNILIDGGTVIATGGDFGPGIGSGYQNCTCGNITIAATIISVTAIKGAGTEKDDPCIGKGNNGHCGDIYFGNALVCYDDNTWYYGMPTSSGTYGGLYVTVSKTDGSYENGWDTWTLTPPATP